MIEILVNDVTLDGMRRLKVVSDAEIDHPYPPALSPFASQIEKGSQRTWKDDVLGLHYLEATWACREVVDLKCEGWPAPRQVVLWKLGAGERVSQALQSAFAVYAEVLKTWPDYAFLRKLPKTIENGFEADDIMFLEAEWVPPGCLVLCTGG